MFDPNDELVQSILARKRQGVLDTVKQNITDPSSDNAYKAGMLLFGGKPQDNNPQLDRLIKLNQAETGSPEFELKKAQTVANIGMVKDLQMKNLERQQLQDAANQGGGDSQLQDGSMPPISATATTPNIPSRRIAPSSTPSFLQGIGQPQNTEGDYESIQKPPLRKFVNGVWVTEPQGSEVKPTLAREAKESAAKERGVQSGTVDPLLGTATGAMRGAIGRFKAMAEANPLGAGRTAGVLNSLGGATGLNPNVKPYNGLKVEVATELAKIANPSGRGAQATIDQFAKLLPDDYSNWNEASNKIHDAMQNAFVRYHSYKFGTPPTAQDMAGFESQIQDILNTPPTKQATMNPQSKNIKSFNSPDEADKSGLPPGTVVMVGKREYQI